MRWLACWIRIRVPGGSRALPSHRRPEGWCRREPAAGRCRVRLRARRDVRRRASCRRSGVEERAGVPFGSLHRHHGDVHRGRFRRDRAYLRLSPGHASGPLTRPLTACVRLPRFHSPAPASARICTAVRGTLWAVTARVANRTRSAVRQGRATSTLLRGGGLDCWFSWCGSADVSGVILSNLTTQRIRLCRSAGAARRNMSRPYRG